jgi:hypothetical protein
LLKNDKPNSVSPGELEGPNVQEIGDSLQPQPGLSERPPHSVGELHCIEPGMEAARIEWIVVTHETQIPL